MAAAAGATDIGASDAYLSPADVSKYTNLVNIPLAVAALSQAQIAKIKG